MSDGEIVSCLFVVVYFIIYLVIFILVLLFNFFVINCVCWFGVGVWFLVVFIVLILLLLDCFFFVLLNIVLVDGDISECFVDVIRVYKVVVDNEEGNWILIDVRWVVFFIFKLLVWKGFIVVYMILVLVLFVVFL